MSGADWLLAAVVAVIWLLLFYELESGRRPAGRLSLEIGGHTRFSPAAVYLVLLLLVGGVASGVVPAKTSDEWPNALVALLVVVMALSALRLATLALPGSSPIGTRYDWGGFGGAFQGFELSTAFSHTVVVASFAIFVVAPMASGNALGTSGSPPVASPPIPGPTSPASPPVEDTIPSPIPTTSPPSDPPANPTCLVTPIPTLPEPPTARATDPIVEQTPTASPTPERPVDGDQSGRPAPAWRYAGALYFESKHLTPLEFADSTPKPEDAVTPEEIASAARGDQRVFLCGHADHVGTEAANALLALQRAEAVRDRLVNDGIEAERIEVCSRGESLSDQRQVRAVDRRVEVHLAPLAKSGG